MARCISPGFWQCHAADRPGMTRDLVRGVQKLEQAIRRQMLPARRYRCQTAQSARVRFEGQPPLLESRIDHGTADRDRIPYAPLHAGRVREVHARHTTIAEQGRFHSESIAGTIGAVRGRKSSRRAGIGAECALASPPPNRCLPGYYQETGLPCEGPAGMTETRE